VLSTDAADTSMINSAQHNVDVVAGTENSSAGSSSNPVTDINSIFHNNAPDTTPISISCPQVPRVQSWGSVAEAYNDLAERQGYISNLIGSV
jgi:hypothetical protein